MKILLDMNLPPGLGAELVSAGFQAVHWSMVGQKTAPDHTIMSWARQNGFTIVTYDLDFGLLLAMTREQGPSVVQIRNQDLLGKSIKRNLILTFRLHGEVILKGALVTLQSKSTRVRILPLNLAWGE